MNGEVLRPDYLVPWPLEGDSDAAAFDIELNKTPRPKIRGSIYKRPIPVPQPRPQEKPIK